MDEERRKPGRPAAKKDTLEIQLGREELKLLAVIAGNRCDLSKIEDRLAILIGLLTPPAEDHSNVRATVRFGDTAFQFDLDGELEFMYVVKTDNPDVGYSTSFVVTDSEGNVLPESATTVEVVSDNPDAVSVDTAASTVHFGNPGLANVNVTVKDAADGDLLGSFGAQFTVTAGDPAAISGGSIAFEGLTEAEPEV